MFSFHVSEPPHKSRRTLSPLGWLGVSLLGLVAVCGGSGIAFFNAMDRAAFGPVISPGMTIEDVVRLRPGFYTRQESPEEYPSARSTPRGQLQTFFGALVLRTGDGKKGSFAFRRGRAVHDPAWSSAALPASLRKLIRLDATLVDTVAALPKDVDARLVREGEGSGFYELPRDLSRFRNYTGKLQGSSLTMSRVYGWTITFREGRVVRIRERAKFGDFTPDTWNE